LLSYTSAQVRLGAGDRHIDRQRSGRAVFVRADVVSVPLSGWVAKNGQKMINDFRRVFKLCCENSNRQLVRDLSEIRVGQVGVRIREDG
jgi:hypothetical protein